MKMIEQGNYIDIYITDEGDLFTIATKEAIKEFGENGNELREKYNEMDSLYELFEDIICNSNWNFIAPEQIGALTDAPIIASGVYYDDNGDIEDLLEDIYWHGNYQVESTIKKIFNGGLVWQKAK